MAGRQLDAGCIDAYSLGDRERCIWLYDTFEGMPPPTDVDRLFSGEFASDVLKRTDRVGEQTRAIAGLDEVKANLATTGYSGDHLRFVEGMVEDTFRRPLPSRSASSASTPTGTSRLGTSCGTFGHA